MNCFRAISKIIQLFLARFGGVIELRGGRNSFPVKMENRGYFAGLIGCSIEVLLLSSLGWFGVPGVVGRCRKSRSVMVHVGG